MLRSLSTKLLLAALLSVLCAVAAYLAVYGIGTLFVNRYYMSTSSVAARKAEIYTDNTFGIVFLDLDFDFVDDDLQFHQLCDRAVVRQDLFPKRHQQRAAPHRERHALR